MSGAAALLARAMGHSQDFPAAEFTHAGRGGAGSSGAAVPNQKVGIYEEMVEGRREVIGVLIGEVIPRGGREHRSCCAQSVGGYEMMWELWKDMGAEIRELRSCCA